MALQTASQEMPSEHRRALACVNARREDKALFDMLHSYWCMRGTAPVSQPDAFRKLLEAALGNAQLDVPAGIRRLAPAGEPSRR